MCFIWYIRNVCETFRKLSRRLITAQEMKFFVKVTFTEEILNGKLHFLRSVSCVQGLKKKVLNLF